MILNLPHNQHLNISYVFLNTCENSASVVRLYIIFEDVYQELQQYLREKKWLVQAG